MRGERISDERLRQMFDVLMAEPLFSSLSPDDQGRVEGIEDKFSTDRSLTPMQVGYICKLYRKMTGDEP
jgi:hypothetical protein